MANGNVSYDLVPEDKSIILELIEETRKKMPFLVSLTREERKKLRKIGPNRLGYATEVNVAANAHKSVLAASFSLEEYNRDKVLLAEVSEIYTRFNSLNEALESTMMALGAEVMKATDTAYDYLKVHGRKSNDESLNSSLKKISAILKQSKKSEPKA